MNIHFVFHVLKLNSMFIDSFSDQVQSSTQSIEVIIDDINYEMKKILNSKKNKE